MAKEKYIKIDPTTGKPDYISEDEGKKIKGVAEDKDLCFVEFKAVQIPVVKSATLTAAGFEFTCVPTDKCKDSHKETNDKKKALKDQIDAQKKSIVNSQDIIDDPKKKEQHKKAQDEKKKAEAKIKELEAQLIKFGPDCQLKFYVT